MDVASIVVCLVCLVCPRRLLSYLARELRVDAAAIQSGKAPAEGSEAPALVLLRVPGKAALPGFLFTWPMLFASRTRTPTTLSRRLR